MGGTTMEDKKCPAFVGGKRRGSFSVLIDLEGEKVARYDLATYEFSLVIARMSCSSRKPEIALSLQQSA
jgi:hypothetical protein